MSILTSKKYNFLHKGLCILIAWLFLAMPMMPVRASDEIVYYHNDALGSPVAATDEQGNLLWREEYKPYGERILKQDQGKNSLWYTGKPEEKDFGINYFGARWYDPTIGRFMAIDPVPFQENNTNSFNRYAYANNNPYRFIDQDGNSPSESWAAFSGYTIGLGNGLLMLLNAMNQENCEDDPMQRMRDVEFKPEPGVFSDDYYVDLSFRSGVEAGKIVGVIAGIIAGYAKSKSTATTAGETELVQRWMSKAELEATQETGLVRGGREGTHYAADAANTSAKSARQRLALPQTPEVRATMEVPAGKFSSPTKVSPNFNMPGGGMERTATGKIPARITEVHRKP